MRGLFEGAQYNSEARATRAVNSRARRNQGNTVYDTCVMEVYIGCGEKPQVVSL